MACTPLSLGFFSKLTAWPALSVLYPSIWTEEKWANRSSLQPSSMIKPYPLALLNHLTLPVGMMNSPVPLLSLLLLELLPETRTCRVISSASRHGRCRFLLHAGCTDLHYFTMHLNCRPNPGLSQGAVVAE